ncbi:hypothetical protein L598_001200000060 [Mesorhizobium sp. J18]|nr:hypothetical protein L598_001200000060 [Mesorhizobium sp. J18]
MLPASGQRVRHGLRWFCDRIGNSPMPILSFKSASQCPHETAADLAGSARPVGGIGPPSMPPAGFLWFMERHISLDRNVTDTQIAILGWYGLLPMS